MTKMGVGRAGEALARKRLESSGYEILEQNWHCRYGEMDLIAVNEGVYVFVEVKTRRTAKYGAPEEALTPKKIRSMVRTAVQYLMHNQLDVDWRIDCIAIEMDHSSRLVRYEHFINAVEGELDGWI